MGTNLLDWIQNNIQDRPLQKKVLLARSFAQGHQLIKRLTQYERPLANLEVQTVESLVLGRTQFSLSLAAIKYINSSRTLWIVHALMHELSKEADAYIPLELIQPGVAAHIHLAITELRTAMVSSADLQVGFFVASGKGRYLKQLLGCYESFLAQYQLVDFAGLIDYIKPSQEDVFYLALPESLPNRISREMLQKLSGEILVASDSGEPFYSKQSGFPLESTEMFHASGSISEVREVLRRLLKHRTRLDRVEIIASDYEKYASIFYTLGKAHGIPCTFAEGLQLETTAVGRTALSFLKWLENDFPVDLMIGLLREGSITFKRHGAEGTGNGWARILENLGIGWGQSRYTALLKPETTVNDEQQRIITGLRDAFQLIWKLVPERSSSEWSPSGVVKAVASFLEHYGVADSPEEAMILQQISQEAESMRDIPPVIVSRELAIRYASEMIQGIRTLVSTSPEPGKLHISSLSSGGWSGRENTFLVGMDERSWSSGSRQDPILLDKERVRISHALSTSAARLQQVRHDRDGRLGMIRGSSVTLSFSSYNAAEKESVSPAFELLRVFRAQSNKLDADYSALREALGQQVGYWSGVNNQPLDQADLWHRELADVNGAAWKDGLAAIEKLQSNLLGGRQAAQARYRLDLSEYDGWVSATQDSEPIEHAPIISASRLEHYARCPMRYYFSYELGLWPKERAAFDRSVWLRPDQKGNLLHQVFYRYMQGTVRDSEGRVVHDREQLHEVTEQTIAEYARMIPSPTPHVFEKELRELREDIEVFYRRELGCRDRPILFEQELSIGGEPLLVYLEQGLQIRIKGFVDRIDQVGPHLYRILDYKTGNPNKYRDNEYFSSATQLQHALYAVAAEEWMRKTGFDEEASVIEAAYIFPTVRGRGGQVIRPQDRRSRLARVVGRLLESMKNGVYVPTKDANVCKWCDYSSVCGHHAEWMETKRTWAANQQTLGALLEVESVD
ncbi:PD-(D/E)XK nuclease family protein [Paenibacillus solisilvae]|uniref:PD-(D/E)XK nuclease family protein n=1 Tax=Paenibacillus solisilvae TaxID=2486751 RepID=A0ABW0VTM3_9BACL